MIIPISTLTVDPALYPRAFVDQGRVNRYTEAMRAGAKLPPISVARVSGRTVVVDGVHRLEAYKRLKHFSIDAENLGEKTPLEAFAEAVRLNAAHGKSLTKKERLAAYKKLVNEGYGIEKTVAIVSVPADEIRKWHFGTATNSLTGKKVPLQASRKLMLWRIRELKSLMQGGIFGDNQIVKDLEELRGLIRVLLQRDLTVKKELQKFCSKIEKTLQSNGGRND